MKKIAIDLDKTLINCNSIIYWVANKYFADSISNKKLKYNFIDDSNIGRDSLISKMISIFSKMSKPESYSFIQNAINIINSWYNQGIEIFILSSRPNFASLNNAIREFLSLSNLNYNGLVVACNNKTKFCKNHNIDLLIDNSPKICLDAQNNGLYAICYNNPRENKKLDNILYVNDWNDINEIITRGYIPSKSIII